MKGSLVPLALGFVLGLQHALDPDHLVAVSTIVSEHKRISRSSLIGMFWGLGHTASLFLTGLVVIGFRLTIPEPVARWMELGVALMLIILGANLVRKQFVSVHIHEHRHGEQVHTHFHGHTDDSHTAHHGIKLGARPFFVGMVHGLAGSAALMLLVLAQIQSPLVGLIYILIFGVGSIGGMLLMSTMIGLPFVWTARRFNVLNQRIRMATGLLSIGYGVLLAWQIGFAKGLLV